MLNSLQRALIEKIGHDHGFEHVLSSGVDGAALASARHCAHAQVGPASPQGYLVHVQGTTPDLIPELQRSFPALNTGTGFSVSSDTELAQLLERAASLARSLPNQAVHDYEAAVQAQLPNEVESTAATEVERLIRQRVGQQKFRDAMLDYWGGACAVTEIALPAVLRASHAKPWSECSSDAERLDVFNGFLLVANLDALFDRFLVSFDNSGHLLVSSQLTQEDQARLGLNPGMKLRRLSDSHRPYLAWHRERWGQQTQRGSPHSFAQNAGAK